MKNVKYILLIFLVIFVFSYFITSCSNLLDNDIKQENMEGKIYINEDGNKLIFRNNKISVFYKDETLIFNDYKISVDNMITLNTKEMGLDVEEIRIYLLRDNSIFFTLDNRYYYCS